MNKNKTERKYKTLKKQNSLQSELTFPIEGDVVAGRFELLKKLGEGAYSCSYLGYNEEFDEYRTLKIFGKYPEVFHSLTDIRSEAKIYSKLEHKSLPKFYSLHEADRVLDTNYVLLELEYIEGTSLDEIMSDGLSSDDKKLYAKQLVESIHYLHFKNIEHNDLKPENIIITEDKKLYLIDFGTSAILKNKKANNNDLEFEGTNEYCPPEARRNEEAPFQRDIFSFGVILYELQYGNYPFEKDVDGQIDYKMPKHLITSKKEIDKVIKNCIQYFPEDRYKKINDVVMALGEALEKKNTVYNSIKKIFTKKSKPIKDISEYHKNDYKYIRFFLICFLVLLPLYLYLREKESHIERIVNITAPLSGVYLNGQYIGNSPQNVRVKKGDLISFTGYNDLANFEMIVGREKKIEITFAQNRVYLNDKLKGMILSSDEKIPRGVNFIALRGDVSPATLQKIRNKNLHVAISTSAPDSLIDYLPKNLKSLSLRNSTSEIDLYKLNRFNKLQNLDLSNTINRDFTQLSRMKSLQVLNLYKTNISDLEPISRLPLLKNLNIESSNVSDLLPLIDNKALERLNINNNSQIDNIFALSLLNQIKDVSYNNPALNTQNSALNQAIERNKEEYLRTQQIIINKKNNLQSVINVITIILLSAILLQLLKMIFRKRDKVSPETKDKGIPLITPENIDKASSVIAPDLDFKRPLNRAAFNTLDLAISDKRYYTPEKNNALYYLSNMLADYPDDQDLLKRKTDVFTLMNNKLQEHLSRNELEPVYLSGYALNTYFPDRKTTKLLKKISKQIRKPEPIKWVTIKEGSFQMGDFYKNTQRLHEVALDGFKISETTITNQQYVEFLNSQGNLEERGQTYVKVNTQYSRICLENGVYFVKEPYDSFPVYEVSWFGALRFCQWLGGRLPTEAEWEFAARSRGENLLYATGELINKDKANYLVDPNDTLWHSVFPVKSFPANKIGLYEMSGNILEWCFDWFDGTFYANSPKNNPSGPRNGEMRVLRGGAWCFQKEHAYTFFRAAARPTSRNNYSGFRAVIPI